MFFADKVVHNNVLYDSVKTTCVGKILLFIYGVKCSYSIRF